MKQKATCGTGYGANRGTNAGGTSKAGTGYGANRGNGGKKK